MGLDFEVSGLVLPHGEVEANTTLHDSEFRLESR